MKTNRNTNRNISVGLFDEREASYYILSPDAHRSNDEDFEEPSSNSSSLP